MAKIYTHACGSEWSHGSYAHCAGCHRTFTGVEAFDHHRRWIVGRRLCVDPSSLPGFYYTRDQHTQAPVWRYVSGP